MTWPGRYGSIQSSQLHNLNILSATAWTVCVYVYMCVSVFVLTFLLWSICSGFIWIITFLWPFFSNFSKARSWSDNRNHNPSPAAEHKKRTANKKIYKCLPALSPTLIMRKVHYIIFVLNDEKSSLFQTLR